jgi:metal-responsive CopG/Arc/MetJ family transcriptional regulator
MDSWIFRIEKDTNIILDKDAVKLSPELAKISDKELRYVILVEDYVKSILRRKPRSERIRNAGEMVFGNPEYSPSKKVEEAMLAYHSLVYETKRESVESFISKINQLNVQLMRVDLTNKDFKEYVSIIKVAQNNIDELNKEIDSDEQEEQLRIKGGKKLSRIEVWQRNQRKFNEHRKQIQV